MEETTVADRVMNLIKSENLSASSFADKIKVQRSAISHISKGRNEPSLQLIKKIIQAFPNVNVEWLFMGNGNMYKDGTSGNKSVDNSATPLPDYAEPEVDSVQTVSEKTSTDVDEQESEPERSKAPYQKNEVKSPARDVRVEPEPVRENPTLNVETVNSAPQGLFTSNGNLILFDPVKKEYTIYKQAQ